MINWILAKLDAISIDEHSRLVEDEIKTFKKEHAIQTNALKALLTEYQEKIDNQRGIIKLQGNELDRLTRTVEQYHNEVESLRNDNKMLSDRVLSFTNLTSPGAVGKANEDDMTPIQMARSSWARYKKTAEEAEFRKAKEDKLKNSGFVKLPNGQLVNPHTI